MSDTRRIAAIVNPHSARGQTARRWGELSQELERGLGPVTARFTESAGHATRLARQLLQEGFDLIIAVGGDGTINETANGFIEDDRPVRPAACLGLLPLGTGGDFQRTVGVPSRPAEAIQILATGAPLEIDIGKICYTNPRGAAESRYFVNLVSFGMGGDVAERSKNFLTPLGGKAAFFWATLVTMLDYRGQRVELELDGQPLPQPCFMTNVAVGNGEFHGGGMHPCPKARLDDGWLDVTVIDYLNLFELLRDIRVLYSDDVYRHPKTHHFRARRLVARSDERTRIEVDGEALGSLPIEITLLPRRLRVIVPRARPPASGPA